MTTARQIITSALGFHLNRLAPGETLDDDLAVLCLSGLNDIADEINGGGMLMWREAIVESASPIAADGGVLGLDWPSVTPGQAVLGVTVASGGIDTVVQPVTLRQYHEDVGSKGSVGTPEVWAYDGYSRLYFAPAVAGMYVSLRVNVSVTAFADLDTDYSMPQGYRSWFSALVSERIAPTVLGGIPAAVAAAAARARRALLRKAVQPGMLNTRGPDHSLFGSATGAGYSE